MPDRVKENLVELLSYFADGYGEENRHIGDGTKVSEIADYLIAHGVTVQEWISVTERLPQEDEPVGLICEQVQVLLSDGFVTTGWCNRSHKAWYYLPYGDTHFIGDSYENTPVIAWQPMSQPPKE